MSKNLKILINFCLYILSFIILCFIGSSGVFALTYTNVAELRDITQQLVSTNYSSGPFTNPINSGYAFSDVLQVDYIISNYNFVANTNYQLESHLTNQQLDNANSYSVQGLNGESCLISYQNSIFQDAYPRWAFQCPHNTNTITISIKNSSNQYLWSGTGIFNWTTALLKSSNTSLSGGSDSTDAIINNQNQNTQDIINNNNSNTDRIIEENNKNFNTEKDCGNIWNEQWENGSFNDNTGQTISNNNKIRSKNYIPIQPNTQYYVSTPITLNAYYYDSNKTFVSANTQSGINGSFSTPNNAYYMMFSTFGSSYNTYLNNIAIFKGNEDTTYCKYGSKVYVNKLDEQKDAINNLNDTINDDNVDENGVVDAFESFNDFLDDNSTITQLITLPITLYTAILNNLNGTCQPFNLGQLYGEDLILPCINISQYLGNSLWTMIDIIISGFAVYAISKKMIKVFNNFSSLREGDVIDD